MRALRTGHNGHDAIWIGQDLGTYFLSSSHSHGDGFAIVERHLAPAVLAAPPHIHTREDEFSYVLEGQIVTEVAEDLVECPWEHPSSDRGASDTRIGTRDPVWLAFLRLSPQLDSSDFIARSRHSLPNLTLPHNPGLLYERYGLIPDFERIALLTNRFGLHLAGTQ